MKDHKELYYSKFYLDDDDTDEFDADEFMWQFYPMNHFEVDGISTSNYEQAAGKIASIKHDHDLFSDSVRWPEPFAYHNLDRLENGG